MSTTASPTLSVDGAHASTRRAEEVAASPNLWWMRIVTGVAWLAAALVVLQFDGASVATVGLLIGIMFAASAAHQFVMASLVDRHGWLWALVGVIFAAAAVLCWISPVDTFVGMADMLGFLFLWVGVWWIVSAFLDRDANGLWWLGLISGPLMIVLAFWTSGQFFITRAYTLLVFAGIWALMQGLTDIVRAFQVRKLEHGA